MTQLSPSLALTFDLWVGWAQSVTLHTSLGEVKIEVFCDQVPKASEVSQSLAASHCAQARALA